MEMPDYMIPSYFVTLAAMPLTANGKIDRKSLPAPEVERAQEYEAPRNELEEKVAGIWAEILGIDASSIGIDDSFFEIGGHSLKATILVAGIHKELDVKLPLAEIFKAPRIQALAGWSAT